MNSSHVLASSCDWQPAPANGNHLDPAERCAGLEAELLALEPLVGAAVLVTTAFRLRDEDGLVEALRLLAQAVAEMERRQAAQEG